LSHNGGLFRPRGTGKTARPAKVDFREGVPSPETFDSVLFCTEEVDMLARFVALLLVVGSLFSLAACNTVDGVGQDISGAARTVKRAL
jgi:predicted small secreted protein